MFHFFIYFCSDFYDFFPSTNFGVLHFSFFLVPLGVKLGYLFDFYLASWGKLVLLWIFLLAWLWAACLLMLRAVFLLCWRISVVYLSLELVGSWVELGFSVGMETFGWALVYYLDSILKSRYITLLAKVHLVKVMVFPVVRYGCESWTVKKAERWRIDAFELWCWRRLLRVPWTAKRSNQSILKESSPGC